MRSTSIFTVAGFSFSGSGQNAGIGFVLLKDWSERKCERAERAGAAEPRLSARWRRSTTRMAFAFAPPPVTELGNSAGFDFYLKDDQGPGPRGADRRAQPVPGHGLQGQAAGECAAQWARRTRRSSGSTSMRRRRPRSGLSMADVNDTLAVAWGGRYIDDFIDRGRVKHVIVQADAPFRMVPEDFNRWYVRNAQGSMVSVASFAASHWEYGSPRLERFNGASAVEINGEAAPGVSSGEAMKEIEKLVGAAAAGLLGGLDRASPTRNALPARRRRCSTRCR